MLAHVHGDASCHRSFEILDPIRIAKRFSWKSDALLVVGQAQFEQEQQHWQETLVDHHRGSVSDAVTEELTQVGV